MTVKQTISNDGKELVIAVVGRFDFHQHDEFRQVLDHVKGKSFANITLDLGAVDDLDSSALGMMLLLRDSFGGDKAGIRIVRCRSEIREMLEMANFQGLFKLV